MEDIVRFSEMENIVQRENIVKMMENIVTDGRGRTLQEMKDIVRPRQRMKDMVTDEGCSCKR